MIRTLRLSDLPLLLPLLAELGYDVKLETLKVRFQALSASGEHYFFVFENAEGLLLSFLHLNLSKSLIMEPQLAIRALVVKAGSRGMGLGKMMVEYTKSAAARSGAEEVVLWAKHNRADAHRFYLREGFRSYGIFFSWRSG
jgi:GNAT superfamily N-acetyltransferase